MSSSSSSSFPRFSDVLTRRVIAASFCIVHIIGKGLAEIFSHSCGYLHHIHDDPGRSLSCWCCLSQQHSCSRCCPIHTCIAFNASSGGESTEGFFWGGSFEIGREKEREISISSLFCCNCWSNSFKSLGGLSIRQEQAVQLTNKLLLGKSLNSVTLKEKS